jgi:hypothetical protein
MPDMAPPGLCIAVEDLWYPLAGPEVKTGEDARAGHQFARRPPAQPPAVNAIGAGGGLPGECGGSPCAEGLPCAEGFPAGRAASRAAAGFARAAGSAARQQASLAAVHAASAADGQPASGPGPTAADENGPPAAFYCL